jgi:hypothetical protein
MNSPQSHINARRIIRTAKANRAWPSGWWLLPALIVGAVAWGLVIWAAVT